MTEFDRSGHWRTNAYGTTYWVRKHGVRRDDWDRPAVAWAFGSPQYKASDFLRRNQVGRGAKGCFVNPNARCPVCSVPVFYYQNSFGSKVYFDDLGPPWPKHPCTDHPPAGNKVVHPEWKPITLRKKGEVQEIIASANILGLMRQKQFGLLQRDEWTLLVIEEVVRTGDLNKIRASLIDTREAQSINFTCYSEQLLLVEGDLVTKNGNEFSFFDRTSMETFNFKNGGWLVKPTQAKTPEPGQTIISQPPAKIVVKKDIVDIHPYQFKRPPLTPSERSHFPKNKNFFKAFIIKLKPTIEQLIGEGIRQPGTLADRLNARLIKTYQKGKWTPKLAQYLVACIYEKGSNFTTAEPKREKKIISGSPRLIVHVDSFFGAGVSYETLVKRCMPMIKRMKDRGTNYQDIADRLNKEILFSSKQYNWTAYAVELLIDLHQNGIRTDKDVSNVLSDELTQTQSPDRSRPSESANMLSREEMARRLSALGRVSMKSEQK